MRPGEVLAKAQERARSAVFVGALAIVALMPGDRQTGHVPGEPQRVSITGCISPYPDDFADVNAMADLPEDPRISADLIGVGKRGVDPRPAAEAYRQEIAQQNGLTIFDGRAIADQLATEDQDGSISYTAYLAAAQKFMANFGIDVRLATRDDHFDDGGRVLTADELNSQGFKQSMLNMIYGYSNVPLQYVEIAGLRHIVLNSGMREQGTVAYTDNGVTIHDTDVFDVSDEVSVRTYGHELGHDLDDALCTLIGMANDPEFASINGGNSGLYNGPTFTDTPNLADYEIKSIDAWNQASHLAARGDAAGACQILDQLQSQSGGVLTVSEYHPNEAEAKAELYGMLFDPNSYVEVLDPSHPVLRRQFIYILARLHAYDPALANYFLAVSRRPIVTSPIDCATNPGAVTGGGPDSHTQDPNDGLQK